MLSVGSGWHPGRHLFPSPEFRLVGVHADPERVAGVLETGCADDARVGYAGKLDFPSRSFDVVPTGWCCTTSPTQGPLTPIFAEAAQLLRPGGAMVAIEPGSWHPIGLALSLAKPLRG